MFTPSNVPLYINVPSAGEGQEEWQKELVNGSQNYMLKGLKEGLSYRVRLVAKGHSDQAPHRSKEVVVEVPGEAVPEWPPLPWPWPGLALHCVVCRLCSSLYHFAIITQSSMGLTDVSWSLYMRGMCCSCIATVYSSMHDCVVQIQHNYSQSCTFG